MSLKAKLEEALTKALKPTFLELIDQSGGCGPSFVIKIVSKQFTNVKLLERHRMVNSAIAEHMPLIHSVSMKCKTPEEFHTETQNM
ncbi:hypothetical protein BmR1_04g08370 [Babesia microti strain RI]|uniref:BolA-like protein n=1 Tax=Babesia microti (strain RI) TaxID=1133968 RepID=I7JDK2_BABMR|nr:hypothetical protein BmR1_04g08370 [Babesia microti strain RI]CCF75855.1 hypothetical protein BmR1_04g08370 [Babesia microti strain RI]|eukprot:XP_012650263.1 hypothetical protein BmR1_04g08370 [Babesia microti strain RI]